MTSIVDHGGVIGALQRRSDALGLLAILRDWVIIASTIAIAEWAASPSVTLLAIWVIGSQQYALGEVLVHEASHRNVFASYRLNERLQFLFAWPLLTTVRAYRKSHAPHHIDLGGPADPISARYSSLQHGFNRWSVARVWLLEPLFGFASIRYLRDDVLAEPWTTLAPGLAINAAIALGCAFAGRIDLFIMYWVIPYVWVFPAFYHWQELEDHFGCVGEGRVSVGRLRNFLHHNSGFHHVHHTWPNVPFFNLRSAFRFVDIPHADISTGFWGTYRALCQHAERTRIDPHTTSFGGARS